MKNSFSHSVDFPALFFLTMQATSLCPKHVGSFGYSTDFLMRRSVRSDRYCKKIMSLVYAKKSDEIGCVLRVCFACFYMRP
jgi:hypothetical protein